MSRLSLTIGPIVIGLLVGPPVGATAQSPEPTPRNQTTTGPVLAVLVTGQFESGRGVTTFADDTEADGVRRQRGRESHGRSEMSDPRLSGDVVTTDNADRYLARGLADILWGTIEIVNDGGTWVGTSVGTSDISADGRGLTYYELVGTGAYEGLSAILFEPEPVLGALEWNGVIFPGDLPPDR